MDLDYWWEKRRRRETGWKITVELQLNVAAVIKSVVQCVVMSTI